MSLQLSGMQLSEAKERVAVLFIDDCLIVKIVTNLKNLVVMRSSLLLMTDQQRSEGAWHSEGLKPLTHKSSSSNQH